MKYAVKVKNKEEQDYVSMKLHGETYVARWNYVTYNSSVFYDYVNVINAGYEIISFDEFKSRYEPQLKIGDTFEYNGFVCEVKEKIEEKKWYYNTKTDKYVRTKHYGKHLTEITNQEFIKQLEENAR